MRLNTKRAKFEDLICIHTGSFTLSTIVGSTAISNGGELIKGDCDVGHWFAGVVEGHPLSMYTPSLESMAEVETTIKQCCDLAHNVQ